MSNYGWPRKGETVNQVLGAARDYLSDPDHFAQGTWCRKSKGSETCFTIAAIQAREVPAHCAYCLEGAVIASARGNARLEDAVIDVLNKTAQDLGLVKSGGHARTSNDRPGRVKAHGNVLRILDAALS